MMRYATPNNYIAQLSSLPLLKKPELVHKLPIYKHQIHKRLEGIPESEITYVNDLCQFCLEETGENLETYIEQFQTVFTTMKSRVFQQITYQIVALQISIRNLTLNSTNTTLDYPYLEGYPEIINFIKQKKHSKFTKTSEALIKSNDYYRVYLFYLSTIWDIITPYHNHHIFNLEGLFIFQLKWHILSAWLTTHNKEVVTTKIEELAGEDNVK